MLLAMKPAVPLLPLDHVDTAALSLHHGGVPSPISMPPIKRPKLSLQTNSLSTSYGSPSSTASNRLETMSAVTPTTLNTFNNTFDLTVRPSPQSATASPNVLQRTKSNASTQLRRKTPYDLNLPLGVRPILKNSDLFYESRRGSLTTSASPRSTRKFFFPPPKKVSFVPVDEEIVTHTYVARHVDMTSSEDESNSDSGREREAAEPGSDGDVDSNKAAEKDVQERGDREEGRSRGSVQILPSSYRSKRKKRRWEWTIENLDKTEGDALIKAKKGNDAEREVSEQPDLPAPPAGAVSEEVAVVPSPHESGNGAGLDETPQIDIDASATTTTPIDNPPGSPWMTV